MDEGMGMLVVDPSQPGPRQVLFERLRLADARDGVTPDIFDGLVDPGGHLAVAPEPGHQPFQPWSSKGSLTRHSHLRPSTRVQHEKKRGSISVEMAPF